MSLLNMGRDYNTLSLDDLNVSIDQILIRAPRKYDDAYICKTFFGAKSESSKLYVGLHNALLVNCKKPNKESVYVYLKLDNKQRRSMLKFENEIMEICKKHVDEWFEPRQKLSADMLDEYFHSGFTLDKSHRPIFKLKMYSPDGDVDMTDMTLNSTYNMTMRLVGVRFQKQNISLVWDIVDINEVEDSTVSDSELESDSDSASDASTSTSSVDVSIKDEDETAKQLETAKNDLKSEIQIVIETQQSDIAQIQKRIDILLSIMSDVDGYNVDDIDVAKLKILEIVPKNS